MKVINLWAQAVEKCPAGFIGLEEERLSDLLSATLNGAFARANREVFIGGGKSDFYVESNTFQIDGTTEIFAGECKIWSGQSSSMKALNQTLTNLTSRTDSALMVIVVKDRDSFKTSRETALLSISQNPSVRRQGPPIAGQSTYWAASSRDPNHEVNLCAIFVDLTIPPTSLPKPKGRRNGKDNRAEPSRDA